jgi:putative membrane-bound dehydrogenase-like protein
VSYCGCRALIIAGLALLATSASSIKAAEPFPALFNTESSSHPLTSPEAALAKIKCPPGFKASLIAAEPEVQNPIGIATDERGRLWVAENYTYAGAPQFWETKLRDRVIVLESSKHHGHFDKRTVFWDEAEKLTSVEVGFGGVWLLCAPKLLFIPDRNHDLVPDGEPEVVLDGFNAVEVAHNVVNGLRWGPDGWLYGRHGILATSLVGKPGAPASERKKLNCGIWRYHPTRKVFEVVAEGTTNPWGMDWNSMGEAFFINTVIGHLFHVIPGAHYKRMYGDDLNQHVYDYIDQHADHYHWDTNLVWTASRTNTPKGSELGGGHAHDGLLFYQGGAWPERYQDTLFTINLHGHRLNNDYVVRAGSGYVGRHTNDFALFNDEWFRGVDLLSAPDGGIYVADWTDTGECHEADGVHRTSGRIYEINYTNTLNLKRQEEPTDLTTLSDLQLVRLQLAPNDWLARQSRHLLQERTAEGKNMADAAAALLKIYNQQTAVSHKLRAMWTLWAIDKADPDWLWAQLDEPNEHVRVWAIRFLTDHSNLGADDVKRFARLAAQDRSAFVRLALASALQRIPVQLRAELATALLRRTEDLNDQNLPLMLWYGIEPLAANDPDSLAQMAAKTEFSLVRKFIARRLTEDIERNPQPLDALLGNAAEKGADAVKKDVLEGMCLAMRGWRKAPKPRSWDHVSAGLLSLSDLQARRSALQIAVLFGDPKAIQQLRLLVQDEAADPGSRRSALQTLAQTRTPNLLPTLIKLLGSDQLAGDAVHALGGYEDPNLAAELVNNYSSFRANVRKDIIATLSSRVSSARVLLQGVVDGKIARSEITAYSARQIHALGDPEVDRLLVQGWGQIRTFDNAEKKQQMATWRTKLEAPSAKAPNVQHGRELFLKTCGVCHKLYGEGAAIGPDLTGSGRRDPGYLLENILDPSAMVPADYKLSIVELKDDRTITGMIREEKEKTIAIQTPTEKLTVERADISSLRTSALSLMPEGLLDGLKEEEVRDLIGYLMTPSRPE